MEENSLETGEVPSHLEADDDKDSRMEEDRTTKKVRLKDGANEEVMIALVENDSRPKISWKDKLMGTDSSQLYDRRSESPPQENTEDFELTEGDIRTSVVNGTPAIDFSERIHQILLKEMNSTVVIKLLGRNIGYGALLNRISSLWNPTKPFHLMDIENGYYLAKFQDDHDYIKVLSQGPWLIYGQYLTVQPWTKDFNSSHPFPSTVLAWIRLPGLPGYFYKKKILEAIGGLIGKVVRLDLNTDNRTRGRFARMAVYINLDKPLTAQVLVNGIKQRVEYEALPAICFNCGKYGHTKELCPLLQMASTSGKEKAEHVPKTAEREEADGAYGPWMVVSRKPRRHVQNNNFPGTNNENVTHGKLSRDRNQAKKDIQLEGAKTLRKWPATQNDLRGNAQVVHAQNMHGAPLNKQVPGKLSFNILQDTNGMDPPCVQNTMHCLEAEIPFINAKLGRSGPTKDKHEGKEGPPTTKTAGDHVPSGSKQTSNGADHFRDNSGHTSTEIGSTSLLTSLVPSNTSSLIEYSTPHVNNTFTPHTHTLSRKSIIDAQELNVEASPSVDPKTGPTSTKLAEIQMVDSHGSFNNNRHTAISFKEKGNNESMNTRRPSGKIMGDKKGGFRATRKINITPYGKGNNTKSKTYSEVSLSDSMTRLANAISMTKNMDTVASIPDSGKSV
ncbi:GroES-like zinc-binding alcohol dehydrogenase family protein [Gossypium australe]|uniref:GroES-like zinc-binding alcohol dehydrogenase family protein n=1 Tax=Gossypium australe TaxID=47621 RepID=A0A5B6USD2_9ROSI|nr:GroES-like zinc-binding alcohol dehydrogenase family protein [Gossypium australe]